MKGEDKISKFYEEIQEKSIEMNNKNYEKYKLTDNEKEEIRLKKIKVKEAIKNSKTFKIKINLIDEQIKRSSENGNFATIYRFRNEPSNIFVECILEHYKEQGFKVYNCEKKFGEDLRCYPFGIEVSWKLQGEQSKKLIRYSNI